MRADSSPGSYAQSLLDYADIGFHENEIARLHARLGDWFATADYLGRVVEELGRANEEREWTMPEEQVASTRLSLALANVSAYLSVPPAAPLGLLANPSGDQHTLGLSIAQPCLRSVGFDTLWVGAGSSAADLASYIRDSRIALVALSASAYSTDQVALGAAYRDIASACNHRGAILILCGPGKWPEPIDYGYRCHSFQEMRDILW